LTEIGEVENECTLHNPIVLAIFVPKLSKLMQIDKVLTKTILTVFENLTPQPMRIYLKNNPAKFHPNPI